MVMLCHNGELQKTWISQGTHSISAFLWGGAERVKDYFSLRKQNDRLAEENFRLQNIIRKYNIETEESAGADSVSDIAGCYRYVLASAVKTSHNKQHNYLILDKGREDGIEELSGVITDKGVIGIVDAVGQHYSYARSFKNTGMTVSARLGKEGPVGELIWNGVTSNGAVLREIPHHIPLHPGDTVYTSGFSAIFPPDIPLGITGEATVVNGSTYDIDITLFEDFSAVRYVTIVSNTDEEEITELEGSDED